MSSERIVKWNSACGCTGSLYSRPLKDNKQKLTIFGAGIKLHKDSDSVYVGTKRGEDRGIAELASLRLCQISTSLKDEGQARRSHVDHGVLAPTVENVPSFVQCRDVRVTTEPSFQSKQNQTRQSIVNVQTVKKTKTKTKKQRQNIR